MRLAIQRENLLKPLGLVAAAVERRHSLPILTNVLLRLKGEDLTLTGTDLEVEVRATIGGVSGVAGEITVPARKLFDICRALPPQAQIELRAEKEKAIIKSGSSRFTLVTMPAADYPNIETAEWKSRVAVSQRELKRLLDKTHFCMAQQDVRYYLNGLLLDFANTRLRAVATDGHRLAMGEVALPGKVDTEAQVIVPRKGVQEILRFLEDSDELLELQLSSNHLRINLRDITFTSKLIDGRFPDYNKVIPRSQSKAIRLPREAFREMLSRAAILSNEKYRGVRLSLAAGLLKVTAHNPEQEEAQEELAVEYPGEEFEIGFNVSYLMEAASALGGDEIELGLTDSDSSGTLRAPGEDQYVYVVMPMRL